MLGALWYLLSIQRAEFCWREQCRSKGGCDFSYFYCGVDDKKGQSVLLNTTICLPANQSNNPLHPTFGIYEVAIENITQSKSFFEKLFFCVWWGLQNLRYV